ncbi:hypothetical protein [Marinilactibacillus sp. Marseille-P9653]|uniref:hypothetical protein n=1 Tax=Marinilactibacillus sp. Marseille-P9653 TaxID=2866583 RepID=UPI001CE4A914|nr:hypothetical protein [Marinilactibacillus sp. Marseille-P9653]
MKELNKRIKSVEAYRTPEFNWKALLKSILTLGFAKPKKMSEAALLYKILQTDHQTITVFSETMKGEQEKIATFHLEPAMFYQKVTDEEKLSLDGYVYHFDLETIKYES